MSGAQSTGNTPGGGHQGDQLRAGREAAGWSRTDIMQMTGISVAKVARIELKGTGTEEELSAYRKALLNALGDAVGAQPARPESPAKTKKLESRSPNVSGHFDDGSVRVTHWNGLERGDLVQLVGDKSGKRYKFLFHHTYPDERGEYVEVSGPVVRIHGEPHGTRLRSIKPERIKFATKRGKRGQ